MNPSQARIVDPVLSNFAINYKNPARVGSILFPAVPVGVSAGKVIEFGTESFRLYNARRAPGASTKQIDFGMEGAPYSLVEDALEAKLPREFSRDAAAVPGIDLGMRAVSVVMNSLTLTLEADQAAIATDPATYDANHKMTLSGADKWSVSTGKPIDNLEDGREAVRRSCGSYPNVALFGPGAYRAIKNHPSIVDRFKYADGGKVTADMLAALLFVHHGFCKYGTP